MPQTMPPPDSRAASIAATTARKSAAARIDGSDSTSPVTPLPGRYGFAKSSARALLARLLSG